MATPICSDWFLRPTAYDLLTSLIHFWQSTLRSSILYLTRLPLFMNRCFPANRFGSYSPMTLVQERPL